MVVTDQRRIPASWASAPISDVADVNPPKPKKDALPHSTPVAFVPMPAVDAQAGAIIEPQEKQFSACRSGYTAFADGDVIFAKITPCMENGKAAIARGLKNGLGFGSTEFIVLRPTDAVRAEYLHYFVRQPSFRKQAEAKMTGSVGQKRVPPAFFSEAEIAVAPLPEQQRIVEKLQALQTRVDACRARLDKIPAILKRFCQSVLAAACSGRLTEDWRAENECRWDTALIGDLDIDIQTGPFGSALHRSDYVEGGVPLVNPMHIRQGVIQPDPDFAVGQERASLLGRYKLLAGDVVLGRRGEMGRAAAVGSDCAGYLCGTGSMFLRPNQETVDSRFLALMLRSHQAVSHFEAASVGSTMTNLNQGIVKALEIPKIDMEEQREIVRRVDALFQLADAVEKRYETGRAAVENLTQSILAKAFRGEMVPQDPTDEPAAVLLARIRAKRHTENPGKKEARVRGKKAHAKR
jgi:type I restriction enzyme, S subunit